ncbi:MAG: helix-hairpin-helix domain-containing protein [bacterium]|nr:helix-hairpin-helix domain-containing protein [bacterium]
MKQHIGYLAIVLLLTSAAAFAAQPGSSGVVNVNTAGLDELQLLPRVGPSLAGRIVEFRKENGPFQSAEELLAVKGIGEKSFDQLKPFIATSGETTLSEKVRLPKTTKGNSTETAAKNG